MWFFLYIFIFLAYVFFLHLKFFNIINSYCLQTIFCFSLSIVYLHLIIVMTSQWNNKVINYIIWSIKNANFLVWFLVHVKLKFYVEKYAAIQSFRVHSFEKQWDCRKRYIWVDIFFWGLVFFLTYTYYNF